MTNEIEIEILATEREIEAMQRQLVRLKAMQLRHQRLYPQAASGSMIATAPTPAAAPAPAPATLPEPEPEPEPEPAPKAKAPATTGQPGRPRHDGPSEAVLVVLRYVQAHGPSTYTRISEATGKAGSTMAKAARWMEKDSSGKLWTLNEQGIQLLAKLGQGETRPATPAPTMSRSAANYPYSEV